MQQQHCQRLRQHQHRKMWALIGPAFKAIAAAFSTFQSERAVYNQAPIVKAAVHQHLQDHRDRLDAIHAILASATATPEDKAKAIQELRVEDSAA